MVTRVFEQSQEDRMCDLTPSFSLQSHKEKEKTSSAKRAQRFVFVYPVFFRLSEVVGWFCFHERLSKVG